jgi:hypothetical protein
MVANLPKSSPLVQDLDDRAEKGNQGYERKHEPAIGAGPTQNAQGNKVRREQAGKAAATGIRPSRGDCEGRPATSDWNGDCREAENSEGRGAEEGASQLPEATRKVGRTIGRKKKTGSDRSAPHDRRVRHAEARDVRLATTQVVSNVLGKEPATASSIGDRYAPFLANRLAVGDTRTLEEEQMAEFTRDMIREVGDALQDQLHPTYNAEERCWTLLVPGLSRSDPRDLTKYHEETWRSHEMSMLVRHYLADRAVVVRSSEIQEILAYLKDARYKSWCQEAMTLASERGRQLRAGEASTTET